MARWAKYIGLVLVEGRPEPNTKVFVYQPGTTTEIPVYEDRGQTQITQPLLSDSAGLFAFFVDADAYPSIKLHFEKDGIDFTHANSRHEEVTLLF